MLSKSTEDCANVDDFKEAFNKKLSRDFDSYDAAQLSLSLTDGGEALQPYDPVPAQNTGDHPLLITITGVSAASPTQLVIPSSTDNTSGNFTATHSPLVALLQLQWEIPLHPSTYLHWVWNWSSSCFGRTPQQDSIVIDIQRDYDWTDIEESPPITIVLITGFDGKPLNEVMAEEEFKRVMPIRPTPSLPGTATPINTTPEWIPGNPKGKIPSYVLCIPIKVCVQNLRRIETELKVDAQNLEKLKLHILSLGGISANADFEDLEEDDSDDDMDVSCERFNRIVSGMNCCIIYKIL
ncbi:hypothetical protein QVD99_002594 [Batrachochytrium dendrobatidis]|nr:hypothetical protein QVD99_002594 [Batrachochytrium dendrobatidis]